MIRQGSLVRAQPDPCHVPAVLVMISELRSSLERLSGSRISVSLSGGVDSIVLLDCLSKLETLNSAIYFDHGLHKDSERWGDFCERECTRRGVPLTRIKLHIDGSGNLEAKAREARYRYMGKMAMDVVCTAHHMDDAVETVLLALLRGGNLTALAGLAEFREVGRVMVWRPFIRITRQQIQNYADINGLEYVEDPSNLDCRIRRNALRHKIIPLIADYFPHFRAHILRSSFFAKQYAESSKLDDVLDALKILRVHGVEVNPGRLEEFVRFMRSARGNTYKVYGRTVLIKFKGEIWKYLIFSPLRSRKLLDIDVGRTCCFFNFRIYIRSKFRVKLVTLRIMDVGERACLREEIPLFLLERLPILVEGGRKIFPQTDKVKDGVVKFSVD